MTNDVDAASASMSATVALAAAEVSAGGSTPRTSDRDSVSTNRIKHRRASRVGCHNHRARDGRRWRIGYYVGDA